eukprot:CAMPEP_0206507974 /NCGR_PEP_ID=MMETSP0324_2-20121206/57964_1 /ASSEMBLY_ACC=CAM_ASM_000836 /TAXON_ID=2866 /ORGANISM="Crypthecodinium cohnii, Strain Seligo" /LENGTH=155 /DNA_ID=CAMNT_0053998565 /DNA_START=85 /DNA_END=552 /DNA_ORIENTATION=-
MSSATATATVLECEEQTINTKSADTDKDSKPQNLRTGSTDSADTVASASDLAIVPARTEMSSSGLILLAEKQRRSCEDSMSKLMTPFLDLVYWAAWKTGSLLLWPCGLLEDDKSQVVESRLTSPPFFSLGSMPFCASTWEGLPMAVPEPVWTAGR